VRITNLPSEINDIALSAFLEYGEELIRQNGYVAIFFNDLYQHKYKDENFGCIKKNFYTAYGIFQFFTTNKSAKYYLTATQLLQILPDYLTKFVVDIYTNQITCFYIDVEISELNNLSLDELSIIIEKYNNGVVYMMFRYIKLLEHSDKTVHQKKALEYKNLINNVCEKYSINNEEAFQ
jgi:hypothetical protein